MAIAPINMITINDVKKYFEYRKLQWCSDGKDAIDFLITECGELMDSYIRKYRTDFVRNNDKNVNISYELADCYMMLMIASHELTGKSLDENLWEKWKLKGYIFDNSVNPVGDWHDKIRGGSNNFTTESDWNKDIFIT